MIVTQDTVQNRLPCRDECSNAASNMQAGPYLLLLLLQKKQIGDQLNEVEVEDGTLDSIGSDASFGLCIMYALRLPRSHRKGFACSYLPRC
jgi:hypothetical protein